MRVEIHIHSENTDLLRKETTTISGGIIIPETSATLQIVGLTHDKNRAMGAEYINDFMLIDVKLEEIEKITDWLYSKVNGKAVKFSVGDLHGKMNITDINKEKMLNLLTKWIEENQK